MGLRITLKLQIQHVRTPKGRRRIVSRSRSWAMGFKADAPWLSKIKAETMERKAFMEEALLTQSPLPWMRYLTGVCIRTWGSP